MAAAFIGGAALGAVFGELFRAVVEAKKKAKIFKPQLEQLESTLQNNVSVIKQIEKFNEELDLPKGETQLMIEKMKEGQQLVLKCLKVKWNYLKKSHYAGELIKLNNLIDRFFQVDMQAQQTRDGKEILLGVRDLTRSITGLSSFSSSGYNGGKFNQLDGIDRPCSVPDPPPLTLGLDVPLEELKKELLKDGMHVIVVSAPGGSGKTTLVKKLCKDEEVEGNFKDNILFVTVSKSHNVKVIVQTIMEHKGKRVPHFQTDEEAIDYLSRLLKEMGSVPILLVLDDVWSGSESMVQDFKFQLPNYKILVTSRFEFPQFGSGYNLKPLNDEDATTLFHYSAIPPDGNSYTPDKDLLNKILKACKGSPLVLTVVGRSLCGAPAAVWRKRVKEWTQDGTIFQSNTDLLVCLQSSLDTLDDKIKECYLDLGLFPEDQRIPVSALIDMWMELYKLAEDDVIFNLNELSKRNLVNLVITRKSSSDDGCYNDHFVVQHDLLRELIIHQSMLEPIEKRKRLFIEISENNFPQWWLEQTLHPDNARLLSISTDETFSSGWYDLKVSDVEALVLNIQTQMYTLPNFMEKMQKLKVLMVTSYGFFSGEVSNFQLVNSLSNLLRIRLERISIPFFDMTTIQMKNLQKISFVLCNVGKVFRNSTFQISYSFPNLKEMEMDYCNDLEELPNGICHIVSLKRLSITNCPKLSQLPEETGKLVNLEVLRLASCTDLEALPDTIGNLSNLKYLDISECLSIKELPEKVGELCCLKMLCMRGCSSCELPKSVAGLKNLKIVQCDEETAYNWEELLADLSNLKLEVLKEDVNLNWLYN